MSSDVYDLLLAENAIEVAHAAANRWTGHFILIYFISYMMNETARFSDFFPSPIINSTTRR